MVPSVALTFCQHWSFPCPSLSILQHAAFPDFSFVLLSLPVWIDSSFPSIFRDWGTAFFFPSFPHRLFYHQFHGLSLSSFSFQEGSVFFSFFFRNDDPSALPDCVGTFPDSKRLTTTNAFPPLLALSCPLKSDTMVPLLVPIIPLPFPLLWRRSSPIQALPHAIHKRNPFFLSVNLCSTLNLPFPLLDPLFPILPFPQPTDCSPNPFLARQVVVFSCFSFFCSFLPSDSGFLPPPFPSFESSLPALLWRSVLIFYPRSLVLFKTNSFSLYPFRMPSPSLPLGYLLSCRLQTLAWRPLLIAFWLRLCGVLNSICCTCLFGPADSIFSSPPPRQARSWPFWKVWEPFPIWVTVRIRSSLLLPILASFLANHSPSSFFVPLLGVCSFSAIVAPPPRLHSGFVFSGCPLQSAGWSCLKFPVQSFFTFHHHC